MTLTKRNNAKCKQNEKNDMGHMNKKGMHLEKVYTFLHAWGLGYAERAVKQNKTL